MHSGNQEQKIRDEKTLSVPLNPQARAIASTSIGLLEAFVGWPLDKLKNAQQAGNKVTLRAAIVGPNYLSLTPYQSVGRCYEGFSAYGVHKVFNRGLKWGLQEPGMRTLMGTRPYHALEAKMGKDNAKPLAAAVSGGILGLLEVVGNPVDRMKILCQTNNIPMKLAFAQMRQEGLRAQYAGAKETALRNVPGSGSLFLGKYLAYWAMGVTDHNKVSVVQSMTSSMGGSILSIVVSHVPDVLKVRAQKDPSVQMGMSARFFSIVKKEGPGAITKGLLPKLGNSGVKLALSMFGFDMLAQMINPYFDSLPVPQQNAAPKFR
jgi:hypothetical protein